MPFWGPSYVSRRAVLSAGALAGITSIAGCFERDGRSSGEDDRVQTDRQRRSEWIKAVSSEATNLNPYRINTYSSSLRARLQLDGAYILDENDEFYSYWVDSYENRGDEAYAFTLRENLEWGDEYGKMTADDWEWFFYNVVDTEENWTGYVSRNDWNLVTAVEAEDEHTFVLELADPDPLFIQRPTMWGTQILPRELTEPYYESWTDGDESAGEDLNTSDAVTQFQYAGNLGPYEFERRDIEDRFVATRNEEYYRRGTSPDADEWEDAPYFDRFVLRVLPEQSTRLSELRTGGITQTQLPADQAASFDDEDVTVISAPTPYNRITAYNQRANGWEPFRNRRIREAFGLAVDKTTIIENIFHGNADVAHTFQPSYSRFYDDEEITPIGEGDRYDPEQARSILEAELPAEYGYDDDVLLGPDGTQVRLGLVYQTSESVYQDTGQYLADAYEDLGVEIDSEGVPGDVMMERFVVQEDDNGYSVLNAGDRDEYTSSSDWDLLWSINLNTYPNSPLAVERYFSESGAANFFGYAPDEEFDSLLADARATTDLDEKREIFVDLFGHLSREQPVNFMIFENNIQGYLDGVVHTESVSASWGYKRHSFWADRELHG